MGLVVKELAISSTPILIATLIPFSLFHVLLHSLVVGIAVLFDEFIRFAFVSLFGWRSLG